MCLCVCTQSVLYAGWFLLHCHFREGQEKLGGEREEERKKVLGKKGVDVLTY